MNLQLDNGKTISDETIERCKKSALKAIKTELPEELQIYEVYLYVINCAKEELRFKRIVL